MRAHSFQGLFSCGFYPSWRHISTPDSGSELVLFSPPLWLRESHPESSPLSPPSYSNGWSSVVTKLGNTACKFVTFVQHALILKYRTGGRLTIYGGGSSIKLFGQEVGVSSPCIPPSKSSIIVCSGPTSAAMSVSIRKPCSGSTTLSPSRTAAQSIPPLYVGSVSSAMVTSASTESRSVVELWSTLTPNFPLAQTFLMVQSMVLMPRRTTILPTSLQLPPTVLSSSSLNGTCSCYSLGLSSLS